MLQQTPGRPPPYPRGRFKRPPLAPQRYSHCLRVLLPYRQAASGAIFATPVISDAANDAPQPFG